MTNLPYDFTQMLLKQVVAKPLPFPSEYVNKKPASGKPLGKGFTIDQLIKKTFVDDLTRSQWVKTVDIRLDKKRYLLRCETVTLEKGKGGKRELRRHRQWVYPVDAKTQGKISDGVTKIKISCDCERWTYWWEVACYKNGCADIIFSNGELPTVNNPMWRVSPCKHLCVILQTVKRERR